MRMASDLIRGPWGHEPVGEEEHGIALLHAYKAMLREPLVKRYMNHLEYSPKPHSNTEWWHALGHQYVVSAQFCKARTLEEVAAQPVLAGEIPIMLDGRLF